MQDVSLEDVQKLMEESREAKEHEERVRQLLGEALTAEDDAAVLQELAAMEATTADAEAAELPAAPKVCAVQSYVLTTTF